MKKQITLYGIALVASIILSTHAAYAFDFTGAWASNPSACKQIFAKTNDNTIAMQPDADLHGDGFIVRNNSMVGKGATCKIKTSRKAGPITHLVAECAAGNVAFSTFQFSYRVVDDNTIVRIYPGVEELNTQYSRCTL
jgi:hypothetical protein